MWYKEGLRFACTECGKCCTGEPGYVFLTVEEMHQIADHLNLDFDSFTKKYIRRVGNRYALLEKKAGQEYECTFLQEKRCQVYGVRPRQCRTFPWWKENLASKEAWEHAATHCEGIGRGALIPPEEIKIDQ